MSNGFRDIRLSLRQKVAMRIVGRTAVELAYAKEELKKANQELDKLRKENKFLKGDKSR